MIIKVNNSIVQAELLKDILALSSEHFVMCTEKNFQFIDIVIEIQANLTHLHLIKYVIVTP